MAETKFGISQLTKTTPGWAHWAFAIVATLTTIATFIVSSDPGIPAPVVVRIIVYLKGLDMFVLALAKMFGVETQQTTVTQVQRVEDNGADSADVIGDGTRPTKGPK